MRLYACKHVCNSLDPPLIVTGTDLDRLKYDRVGCITMEMIREDGRRSALLCKPLQESDGRSQSLGGF